VSQRLRLPGELAPMGLRDLPPACYQGVVPAIVATCDAKGIPNSTYLSQVHLVDDTHVALSCQFFNKTKRNVLENPYACVELHDPETFDAYRLELRYLRAETEGPLFDGMSLRIEAIAYHAGMQGIFRLLSADVYEVLLVERLEGKIDPAPLERDEPLVTGSEIGSLQLVSVRVSRARDLDELLSGALQALEDGFGFRHSMILLLDEAAGRLQAIASHGYGEADVGAEVGMGEGLIGAVARERCILRVGGVGHELRYGRAIRASVHREVGPRALRPEIPLPGLVDAQSQMAMPLVVGDRLIGVIALESRSLAFFEEWHEAYLEIIANQVAVAIDNMIRRERDAAPLPPLPSPPPPPPPPPPELAHAPTPPASDERVLRLRFFRNDDCVFADDEYLVRNVPGKILWRIVRIYTTTGRSEFCNRELRLDSSLGLPTIRDNLESRLVLLRRRLEQKCPELALVSTGRGQFRLEVRCRLELEESDGS
jgi:adenylate cyclase